ncbi:MAG: cytochrome c3 family protein [Rhodocyclaceae bacterium]
MQVLRRLAGALLWLVLSPLWAQSIESVVMPGKLIQGHADLEAECRNCHVRFDRSAQTGLCLACHRKVAGDVRAGQGYHGRLRQKECRACHTDHKGRDALVVSLDEKKFDHARTDFELAGKHTRLACKDCHKPKIKHRDTPSACIACHERDDKHEGSLGRLCGNCHDARNWKEIRFDHGKTRFPLAHKHADVKCADCHRDRNFRQTPRQCIACHRKDDAHKGSVGPRCESCHDERDWRVSSFEHDRKTHFPLRDKHHALKCQSCHRAEVQHTPADCLACHRKDDAHKGSLGARCESCHNERGWRASSFDHDRKTHFPLLGKHRSAKCQSCHKEPASAVKLPLECLACHRAEDPHKGRLGEKCERCHTEKSWKETRFDHDRDTRYPLRGLHRNAKCAACHRDPAFREKTPEACVACHRKDDEAKGHRGRYAEKCESCHTERGWKRTIFDHDRDTRYRLTGKHGAVKCDSCHRGVLYRDKPKAECFGCHEKDDRHEAQLGRDCGSCHDERSWKETRFDHARSRFPLLGRHAAVACKDCHASPAFRDARMECLACHEKQDVHKRRLGPACAQCHNARDWKLWDFDHGRRSRFPLDGGHLGIECYACHVQPVRDKVRLAATCGSCHRKDDVHDGNFGPQCERCHFTDRWKRLRSRPGAAPAASTGRPQRD